MEYLIPIIALSASFLTFVLCFIFLFGKRFYLWLIQLLISVVLCTCNGLFLYNLVTLSLTTVNSDILDWTSFFLTLLSLLYLILTVILRIIAVPKDTSERINKQSYSEAKYVTVTPMHGNGGKE